MSSLLDTVTTVLPYHLMCYGTLLGFQIYQSFINTKLCFWYLPKPQFRQLTKRVFRVYFRSQVWLVVLTAATHPSGSLVSLSKDYAGLGSLSLALGMGLLNSFIYGPKTTESMALKSQQETKVPHMEPGIERKSAEASLIDRGFSRNHAMAIHLNAISILATLFYGFHLSARLQLG